MKKYSVRNLILIVLLGAMLPLYQNCSGSASRDPSSVDVSSSADDIKGIECGDMQALFNETYRPFLRNNCASCHIAGGVGKGQFADADGGRAWSAFQLAGFSQVSDNAVNPGHHSPYTGTQHTQTVSRLKETWIKALEEGEKCKNQQTPPPAAENLGPRINSTAKVIGLNVGGSKTLEWVLNSEFTNEGGATAPSINGAVFSVRIQAVQVLGQLAYYISEPRIRSAASDVRVQSIRFKLNGQYIPGETTFNFVDASAYKNSNTLLSAGTMVVVGTSNSADTLTMSLGSLAAVTLPPPYAGPTVGFAAAAQTVAIENGVATLTVTINEAPKTNPVVVTVKAQTSSTGKGRRSARTVADPYDYFDWDYTLGTVAEPTDTATLTFLPQDPNGPAVPLTQSIQVLIANDDRDENNETAVFRITDVQNGVLGSAVSHTVTIPDNDAAKPVNLILSYTQLMSPGGVLRQYCLECHNTVKKEGGYDLTDFPSMLSMTKQILNPANPTAGQMYLRIRLQCDPITEPNCGRMPIGQGLEPVQLKQLEDWIKDGSKNN